ncbi:MAG: ABC transporter substrate-binding protein, partial [Proteobacteria bacterium]|nr:ABC transporter substrate-binding protein [Pseudomonadota bacterium]
MNNRRKLVSAFGAAILTAPFWSFALQQERIWRIGFLSPRSGPDEQVEAFRDQLHSLGYVEGRNLSIVYRWGSANADLMPKMAAELVQLKVDVIVAQATASVEAAKRATSTIPIVMVSPSDAVGQGLVASLSHPGGNVTGSTLLAPELAGKRLQLLREVLPKATRVAVLADKDGTGSQLSLKQNQATAQEMGITLVVQFPSEDKALPGAFAAMARERAQAVLVHFTPFTSDHRKRIVELAAQQRLPAMFEIRGFV